jgi:hypothetical protein
VSIHEINTQNVVVDIFVEDPLESLQKDSDHLEKGSDCLEKDVFHDPLGML